MAAGMTPIRTEAELTAAARALAGPPGRWSADLRALAAAIRAGEDPLGDAFLRLRAAEQRRAQGATYTPPDIVAAMADWAARQKTVPVRVVDPGAGSGRFVAAAAVRFPDAALVAVESDPLAVLMLRANAALGGFAGRLTVVAGDYRALELPAVAGPTLFLGNPPYVRHHELGEVWKRWFAEAAAAEGMRASKLAGLHVHFFLKTLLLGREGDFGAFITSSEWLDVNYGALLRRLLAERLGGTALHVLDPAVAAFPDAITTAAITCFAIGRRPATFRVRAVESRAELNGLTAGRAVPWDAMRAAPRWSVMVRPGPRPPAGHIELGELFRVHRGQVTGANAVWIAGPQAAGIPDRFLAPTVTRARELIAAGAALEDAGPLKRVVDLPIDLGQVPARHRAAVERFLAWARACRADAGYVARNRRAWWAVGLREPAPIVCTYMARRPPAFVRNLCGARLLNIAHGLYPREPLGDADLDRLIAWLRVNVRLDAGRAYAGGLTKFEPREVERIAIPRLEDLPHGRAAVLDAG